MIGSIKNALFNVKAAYKVKAVRQKIQSIYSPEGLTNQRILFCPFNSSLRNMGRESIIATACERHGAKVEFLQYDLLTPKNEFMPNRSVFAMKIYFMIGKMFYRIQRLKTVRYSAYLNTKEFSRVLKEIEGVETKDIESFTYKNVNVGKYAITGAIRNFMAPAPLWDDTTFVAEVRALLIEACRIAISNEEILAKNNYDKIVMSHGIYLSWGILFDMARAKGINVDVYNGSYRKNTLRFYKNVPNAPFPVAEWPTYENKELTSDENKILNDYIETRVDQSDDNISLFKEDKQYEVVDAFLEKAKSKGAKVACLFTNISWDAYSFSDEAIFPTMNDWMRDTVDYVKENYTDELYLIVKAHPAERFHKVPDKYRVKQYIQKNLPENILFISEDMEVKPFDIYPHIDFGIIHISTVCIEMALKNIPVLTSGANGHYSNKGFTYDPKSQDDYFKELDALVKATSTFTPDIEMAKKYMYYRFFTEAIPYGYIDTQNGVITIDPNKVEQDEASLGGLKSIVEGILFDKPFVFDWTTIMNK